jgi:hypothetical protein
MNNANLLSDLPGNDVEIFPHLPGCKQYAIFNAKFTKPKEEHMKTMVEKVHLARNVR